MSKKLFITIGLCFVSSICLLLLFLFLPTVNNSIADRKEFCKNLLTSPAYVKTLTSEQCFVAIEALEYAGSKHALDHKIETFARISLWQYYMIAVSHLLMLIAISFALIEVWTNLKRQDIETLMGTDGKWIWIKSTSVVFVLLLFATAVYYITVTEVATISYVK